MESNYYKHLHSEESKGTKEYDLHRAMKCLELIAIAKDRIAVINNEYGYDITNMPHKYANKKFTHWNAIVRIRKSYNHIISNLTKF